MEDLVSKNLIVLCDGTWNTEIEMDDNYSTNVALLARHLMHQSGQAAFVDEDKHFVIYPSAAARLTATQVVFYSRGVGSMEGLDHYWGGLFGKGINRHIMDAYRFLVEHYSPGDKIFVFGFSRGAYTVRSLVGLIRNVGLADRQKLPQDKIAKNKFYKACFTMYKSRRSNASVNSHKAALHRGSFAHGMRGVKDVIHDTQGHEVDRIGGVDATCIHYMGIWDTVGALGVPEPFSHAVNFLSSSDYNEAHFGFHDTRLSKIVHIARHAVAVDEHRKAFDACLWSAQDKQTDSEQRWLPGAHGDIGGGYEADRYKGMLSHLAGYWIVQEAISAGMQASNLFANNNQMHEGASRIETAVTAEIHDPSKESLWRLGETIHREIGISSTDERISDEAVKRFQRRADYRPDNLKIAIRALNLSGYFS
jgi:uncharacterized protein (DUF2235 family)